MGSQAESGNQNNFTRALSLRYDHPGMKELFIRFVQSPNRESFLAVRTAVISSNFYDPYSKDFEEIDELVESGKFDEASEKIAAAMPNLLLSPRAHMISAFLAERSNDQQRTEMEDLISVACCEGILATGDGSKDNPYLVLRTSDEYDVIEYCQQKISGQALINDGEQHFDLMQLEDGTEMWFDVTDAFKKLEGTFGDSKE